MHITQLLPKQKVSDVGDNHKRFKNKSCCMQHKAIFIIRGPYFSHVCIFSLKKILPTIVFNIFIQQN